MANVDFLRKQILLNNKPKKAYYDNVLFSFKDNDVIYARLFLKFLLKNDLYQKYIDNLTNKTIFQEDEAFISMFPIKEKYELINFAFSWENSYEGFDFWSSSNKDWTDFVRIVGKRLTVRPNKSKIIN